MQGSQVARRSAVHNVLVRRYRWVTVMGFATVVLTLLLVWVRSNAAQRERELLDALENLSESAEKLENEQQKTLAGLEDHVHSEFGRWGLTEALGPLAYSEDEDEVFLGRSVTQHKHVSDETALKIDMEIRNIVDIAHKTASDLVNANRDKLEVMTEALMKYETIDASQIDEIMNGNIPSPPADWDDSSSDGGKKAKADTGTDASAEAGDDSADKPEDKPSIGGTAEQH